MPRGGSPPHMRHAAPWRMTRTSAGRASSRIPPGPERGSAVACHGEPMGEAAPTPPRRSCVPSTPDFLVLGIAAGPCRAINLALASLWWPAAARSDRVSALLGQGISPCPASYAGTAGGRGQPVVPGFLVPFAADVRFWGLPAPAEGFQLPHGRPTGQDWPAEPRRGFTFRMVEIRPGWCRLNLGDGGAQRAQRHDHSQSPHGDHLHCAATFVPLTVGYALGPVGR